MYGKIFDTIYDGTLRANWQALVTFQQLIILADKDGIVDMTPHAIHGRTGIPLDIIEAGLKYLSEPDPYSRSNAEEGRRLILLDPHRPWGWRLVNHAYYSRLRSIEEKREADRQRIADKRKTQPVEKQSVSQSVADCSEQSQPVADVAPVAVTVSVVTEPVINSYPPDTLSSDARPQSDTKTVFQHWQQKLNHPHAKLTPERQRKITAALKNYSAASLCLAVDGCAVTPHNMGQNDRGEVYDDISLIVRDAAHIERFIRNAKSPPKANGAGHGKPSKLQIAAEAIRRSNPERYGTPAVVQDAGPEPRLRTLSGRPAGGDSGDD